MTTTAMNNNLRTRAIMRNKDIKKEAHKAGYQYKGYWPCEACKEEAEMASQSVGYTGKPAPWVNFNIALKFYKKGSTIAACKCGWRKDITIKFTPVEKRRCAVRGCNVVLAKDHPEKMCFRCKKEMEGGGNPATYAADCSLKPKKGCDIYVQEGRAGCVRTKCNKYTGKLTDRTCKNNTCMNPVPQKNRKYCTTCHPPKTKKEKASTGYNM